MKRRIVITGLGAVTALGEGVQPLWQAALEGRSGIGVIESFGEHWHPIAAVLKDFEPEKFIVQKKSIKVMARDIQMAVAAASLAVDDANARTLTIARDRFGVIVGSGVLDHELDELGMSLQASLDDNGKPDLKRFGDNGISSLFPLWLLKYLPNMSACHVSILFDLQGPNNTITTGASAGLQAVGEAFRIIERGSADMMLAGGAESKVNPVGLTHYAASGVLTDAGGHDPRTVYRPFDRRAKGFVAGEGAGFLVLEEFEHAKKRNAKIYAEITGFGASSKNGLETAMRAALCDAGLSEKDLDLLQACGIGIAKDDLIEAEAIEKVLGSSRPGLLVSASKPVTGFTGFSAGALDLILSSLSLFHQAVPPTLNLEEEVRPWKFNIVRQKAIQATLKNAMTNTAGFNGQCVSMITKAYGGNA